MATTQTIKCLFDLPTDAIAAIFFQILETVGLWKILKLRLVCKLFQTFITKTIILDYKSNPHGAVDDALEICLNYPICKLPGIAPLLIHEEMIQNPRHAVLAPIYQAIRVIRARHRNMSKAEQISFEMEVCQAVKERLTWSANEDRDPRLKGRRKLIIRRSTSNILVFDIEEESEARNVLQSTLSVAIIAGDVSLVQNLLEFHHADANIYNECFGTPLHLASSYGKTQIVEILLEHGADLALLLPRFTGSASATDPMGLYGLIRSCGSALRIAVLNGHLDTAKSLIRPRFNAVLPFTTIEIRAIFRAAAYSGSISMAEFLMNTDLEASSSDSKRTIEEDMLVMSIYWGSEELAKVLIKDGVDINCVSAPPWFPASGWSPIHSAAYKGRSKMVQFLLDNGADPTVFVEETSIPGVVLDAMGFAVTRGHEDVVHILVNHGIPLGASRGFDTSLVVLASMSSQHRIMRLFLRHSAVHNEPISQEMECWIAIMHAIDNGDLPMLRLLVENTGCSFHDKSYAKYVSSPVLAAMKTGWSHIVEYLLSVGAQEENPFDLNVYPAGSDTRIGFTSGRYPLKRTKQPHQLWHIQGKY